MPQLLDLFSRAQEAKLPSPCASATEPKHPRACVLQRETTAMKRPCTTTKEQPAQQQRPSTTRNQHQHNYIGRLRSGAASHPRMCACVRYVASVVSDSVTPWTLAHQAPLSVGFSRQGYWSGLPRSSGDRPEPRMNPHLFCLVHWQASSSPLAPHGKPHTPEWPLSKNLQTINAGEGVERREPSYTAGGNIH